MNRAARTFPVLSSRAVPDGRSATWPAMSIVLLVGFAGVFPPGMLTGMNLYLLLLACIVWFFSGEPFDKNLLRVLWPLGLIIFFGLVVGAPAGTGGETERYNYLKDAWYISNPAVIICVGYVLYRCMPDVAKGMRAFVIAGTLLSIFSIVKLAMHPELLKLGADKLREALGTGYYAPALAFAILFAYRGKWRAVLGMPSWLAALCFTICVASIGASLSRTILIVSVIGVLASYGIFARKEWLRLGGMIVIAALAILSLRTVVDVDSREATTSFIGKLARATDELAIQEYTDLHNINVNWRGYETARALNHYLSGSPFELVFGEGFGAQLDIGLFMPLGSGTGGERLMVRFVPILHNGYAYLLVKGGACAVLLFAFALAWLYRVGRRKAAGVAGEPATIAARVMQACVVSLLVTTWLVAGVFNKLDLFAFMLAAGFLLAALTRGPEADA